VAEKRLVESAAPRDCECFGVQASEEALKRGEAQHDCIKLRSGFVSSDAKGCDVYVQARPSTHVPPLQTHVRLTVMSLTCPYLLLPLLHCGYSRHRHAPELS